MQIWPLLLLLPRTQRLLSPCRPPLLCGVLCLLFKDSLTQSLSQEIVISGTQETLRYCFISCYASLLIYSGRREAGVVKEACVWSGEATVCCWLQSLFFFLVRKQAQRRLFYVFWVFLFRWGLNCRQLVGQEKNTFIDWAERWGEGYCLLFSPLPNTVFSLFVKFGRSLNVNIGIDYTVQFVVYPNSVFTE